MTKKREAPAVEIPEDVAATIDQLVKVQGDVEALVAVAREKVNPDQLRSYLRSVGLSDDPEARALLEAVEEARRKPALKRRLIIAADLVWTPEAREASNAIRLARGVRTVAADGITQIAYYTHRNRSDRWLDKFRGAAFAASLGEDIEDAYRFLVDNYEPDDDIFLFGFSRGAFVACSVAAMVRRAGVLRKEYARARMAEALALTRNALPADAPQLHDFRASYSHDASIQCLGVWENVGALGIPLNLFGAGRQAQLHDTGVPRIVKNAFHALAIDETRAPFAPMLWSQPGAGQRVEQVWFAGSHADVGGGYAERGLSDIALGWMMDRAVQSGLELDPDAFDLAPDPAAPVHESASAIFKLLGTRRRRIGDSAHGTQYLHESVRRRMELLPEYRPSNLRAVELPVATDANFQSLLTTA